MSSWFPRALATVIGFSHHSLNRYWAHSKFGKWYISIAVQNTQQYEYQIDIKNPIKNSGWIDIDVDIINDFNGVN